jgi:hypothetical protein
MAFLSMHKIVAVKTQFQGWAKKCIFLDYFRPLSYVRISKRENNLKIGPNNFLETAQRLERIGMQQACRIFVQKMRETGSLYMQHCSKACSTLSNIVQ